MSIPNEVYDHPVVLREVLSGAFLGACEVLHVGLIAWAETAQGGRRADASTLQDNATGLISPGLNVTSLPSSSPTSPKPNHLGIRDGSTAPWAQCVGEVYEYGRLWGIWYSGFGIEDEGKRIKKEEKGCGIVSQWKFQPTNCGKNGSVNFVLPAWFKAGCVERAIHSAGGPLIKCDYPGFWEGPGDVVVPTGNGTC